MEQTSTLVGIRLSLEKDEDAGFPLKKGVKKDPRSKKCLTPERKKKEEEE